MMIDMRHFTSRKMCIPSTRGIEINGYFSDGLFGKSWYILYAFFEDAYYVCSNFFTMTEEVKNVYINPVQYAYRILNQCIKVACRLDNNIQGVHSSRVTSWLVSRTAGHQWRVIDVWPVGVSRQLDVRRPNNAGVTSSRPKLWRLGDFIVYAFL